MNQLTAQQGTQALDLRKKGHSYRDIAAELGINKSQVEKFFIQQQAIQAAQPITSQQPVDDQQKELETERIRLASEAQRLSEWEQQLSKQSNPFAITSAQHSRELSELAKQTAALAQERAELEQRKADFQRLLQTLPGHEEQYQEFVSRAKKEKLVNGYNRLIQQVLDNCDDTEWSGDEVDDFLARAEAVKTKVVALCDTTRIDERRLLIYQGLLFLINDIEEEQQEQTSGFFASSSVDIDFSDQHQVKYKSFMVDSFEQEAPVSSPTGLPSADDDDDLDQDDDE